MKEPLAWSVLAVLALFHVLATLGYSLRAGPLSIVPLYDDLAYLLDALDRLKAFDGAGLFGLAHSLIDAPPHAPITAVVATLGFALTPNDRFGGYALCGVWVFAVLMLGAHILRGLPSMTRAGLLCALLAVPMMSLLVATIRPDASWGLLTGCTATIVATTNLLKISKLHAFLIGILVGVTAISKPTGMPAGTVVMGVAYLGSAFFAVRQGWHERLPSVLRNTLMLALGAVVVVLPYLAVAGRELAGYIRNVMVEQRDVWQTEGSLSFHLLYYLGTEYPQRMMGWLWPVGVFFVLGNGACAIMNRKTDKQNLACYLNLLAVLLVSYTIPAASSVKSLYIGSLFYGTAAIVFLWNLGGLLRSAPPFAVATGGVLLFLIFWTPGTVLTRTNDDLRVIDAANRTLAPAVLQEFAQTDPTQGPRSVLVASPGPVFDGTLKYFARTKNLRGEFRGGYLSRTLDELVEAAALADVVIATEFGAIGQGGRGVGYAFPATAFQNRLIAMMERDRAFHSIASYTDAIGYRTIVFARRIAGGAHITRVIGFREPEGPYPTARLPVFRWMTSDHAVLHLIASETVDVILELRCQSVVPTMLSAQGPTASAVTTRLNGPIGGSFSPLEVPLSLKANEPATVTLDAAPQAAVPPGWPGPLLCTPFALTAAR